ncbi:MAG: fatty acid desaturase, partial [Pseudomonadota bacterium]
MQRFPVARRRSLAEIFRAVEGPTWVALCACYTLWMLATAFHAALGLFWVPLAAIAVAFHSSLQHEALHGHPTRSRLANEALVFPALGLILPYRRYRDTHLRHHDNSVLTDPYDDPESWYLAEGDLSGLPHPLRWVFEANRTLAGRMILGPLLGLYGFLRADLRRLRAGER